MTILVVDDEPSFRLLVWDYLTEEGYTVVLADDGEDGLQKLQQEKIDLVISDLHSHVMDGLKFCRTAREMPGFKDMPFLFVSAHEDHGTLAAINSFRNSAFLKKGEPMSEIITWIQYLTKPKEDAGNVTESSTAGQALTSITPSSEPTVEATITARHDPGSSLILIVDDDESLRMTLTDTLTKEGYFALAAADGSIAIDLLKEYQFDLVLLDMMMPGISGLDVLTFIKEHIPGTRVIMVTAYADLKLAVESKKLGASDFIAKPFMRQDLLTTIERALSQ